MSSIPARTKSELTVFRSALSHRSSTRADIAAKTGLSIVTVGSIIDRLVDMRILHQHSRKTGNVGRVSRYIEPSNFYKIPVYSISISSFSLNICGFSLSHDIASAAIPSDCFTFAEDLRRFIISSREILKKNKMMGNRNVGIGIIIGGGLTVDGDGFLISETDSLINVNIKKIFEDAGFTDSLTVTDEKSEILRYLCEIEDESCSVFSLFINDKIESAYFRGKDSYVNCNECGSLPVRNCRNVLRCTDIEKQAEAISDILLCGIVFTSPDKVYLSGSIYTDMKSFCNIIRQKTELKLYERKINSPEFKYLDDEIDGIMAIAAEIRDTWMLSELTENNSK